MRPAFRRFVSAAQAFAFTSALTACVLAGGDNLVVPGGAEDFPNTVTPLGRIAVSDFTSVSDWEQVPVVTPTLPELPALDSLMVSPPGAKVAVLGKAGATGRAQGGIDTLDMSLWEVDTTRKLEAYLLGRVYAYAADSSETFVQRDTVSALYLGERSSNMSLQAARDSVISNPGKFLMILEFRGTVMRGPAGDRDSWVRQSYRLRNMDLSGTIDLAEYRTVTPLAGGRTMTRWVKVYGPDGAYAEPQAVPEEFELLERGPAGDTLSWTYVKDADWDRKLWGSEGHGVVDMTLRLRNPEAQPAVSRLHSQLRAGYHVVPGGRDSLSQLSYQEQRWLRNGRNVSFSFKGQGADGLLAGGDTARMVVDTVFALQDSLIKYSATYAMLLGSAPERLQEHRLVGYSVSKHWRVGALHSNTSQFLPESPVPMGQSGFNGTMSTTAIYANGDTTVTEGTVDSTGFNLIVRNVKKNVVSIYEVVLDKAGELVRFAPVAPDATAAPRRAVLRP